ncbi:MAG: efflux RND transporter permease subunit [Bacteroidales bacterium]|nr:efflux RND transporter permease subunit [Bacteroidales bacterium]
MHIAKLVFKKKAIFYLALLSMAIGGIISYMAISKLEDPEIQTPLAKIITIYPGASAHQVEMEVTNVLEDAISELADINKITSKSSANVSMIDVMLELTVPQEEVQQRWEFLRRKLEMAQLRLPNGARAPMVFDDIGDVYGMFYAITADGYSYREMSEQAQFLKRNLLQVKGVRKVAIYGEQPPVIDIVLSPERMARLGIMPLQVMMAVQDYCSTPYAGNLLSGGTQMRVTVGGRIGSADDLRQVLIKGPKQQVFKLADIAEISEGYTEPLHNTLHLNNQKALGLSLSMEPGENIVSLGQRVDEQLAELQSTMPAGFELHKIFNQPNEVKHAIADFMVNIVMSVAIVVLVLMLTMGLRSGLIIGSGLVLTILATFPLMYVAGGTMQRISLGAFIVAMGMLVDNAIVVIDGILVRMQTHGRTKSTFTQPAIRTAWPLLGATLIAITAFLPAVLSKDAAGTYVHDLFVVLCISLFISWLLALTQVPFFSAIFLKSNIKKNKNDAKPIYSGKAYSTVRRTLEFCIKHKLITLGTSALLLALCALGIGSVKRTFFPDFNYNQAYIEYRLPDGSNADRVHADLREIADYLLNLPQVQMVVTSQGQSPTRYCLVRPIGDMADSYGELIVNFESYAAMIAMKPQLEDYLRSNYPQALTRIRKYNLSVASSHNVEAQFSGPDPAVLKQLAAQVEGIMRRSPYADPHTICTDWNAMGKSLRVDYLMSDARRNSTSRSDIAMALLAATDGLPLGTIYEGETPIPVSLKLRNPDGSRIGALADIPVWNMLPNLDALNKEAVMGLLMGTITPDELRERIVRSVPLSAVSQHVGLGWEETSVTRVNRKRTIQAQCDVVDGHGPATLLSDIKAEVEAIALPEGYTMEWVGEHVIQHTAIRNIFRYVPVTAMLIVLLLVLLFNDARRPLIVVLCIPMSMVGIIPGLLLTGQPYTFIAIVGTFGLAGMLIKNAIVLLDEIELQLKAGQTRYHAIIDATVARTRPVLMASITTILGMLPLLFDPMYCSMAVTIISGLIAGTLITLIFVPVLYAAFYKVKSH